MPQNLLLRYLHGVVIVPFFMAVKTILFMVEMLPKAVIQTDATVFSTYVFFLCFCWWLLIFLLVCCFCLCLPEEVKYLEPGLNSKSFNSGQ